MERKFTDDEIVKALECCKNADCFGCPFDGEMDCVHKSAQAVLALIKRQKADIQRLNFENLQMIASIKHLKSEAHKEFAERLKAKAMLQHGGVTVVYGSDIDTLVKEMTGEDHNGKPKQDS